MKRILMLFAVIAAMVAPTALVADPITGQFSIAGTVTNTGTALNFAPGTTTVGMGTQTGTFATLLTDGQAVNSMPATIDYSPYVPDSAVIGIDPLTITLETLVATNVSVNGSTFTLFSGDALFSAAGYDTTSGTFSFSTQGNGAVTFSATGLASPVPEPSSILLFGTGALALMGLSTKRLLA